MSLICNETLACEQCIDCQKVLNHQYADIIEIDGEEESIKKKHIENIQETFKKSSLEGKAKVYILKNVEKTTKEAMNALLKILEEPTEGIYAIFTTKNINRILPTIISRCQVIELKPDNKEVLKEKLIAKGYEEEKASVLSYIIKDEDDLENINQDNGIWLRRVYAQIRYLSTENGRKFLRGSSRGCNCIKWRLLVNLFHQEKHAGCPAADPPERKSIWTTRHIRRWTTPFVCSLRQRTASATAASSTPSTR